MSTNFYTPAVPTTLTLNLEDGATALFPIAFVFSDGMLIESVNLSHVSLGLYAATWVPGALLSYSALFIVYDDALHTVESTLYTRELERWQSDVIVASAIGLPTLPADIADSVWDELLAAHTTANSAGEFLGRLTQAKVDEIGDTNVRVRLLEKIARNRLELADGSTGNWVLYDDDSLTPLLTFSISDKNGSGIVQQALVPSRRTRGA